MHHETALLYQFSLQLIAIIVKCLRRTPLFACRMASGLMEILKARNSINLLLIDLISFLRPPIDTPKKYSLVVYLMVVEKRRWGPQLIATNISSAGMRNAVLCFCFSFLERESLKFLKISQWNFLIGFIVMSTTIFYSFVKLSRKILSLYSCDNRFKNSLSVSWRVGWMFGNRRR